MVTLLKPKLTPKLTPNLNHRLNYIPTLNLTLGQMVTLLKPKLTPKPTPKLNPYTTLHTKPHTGLVMFTSA